MKILFKNIKQLIQVRDKHVDFVSGKEMAQLPLIENAYLLAEDGIITDYGKMENCPVVDDAEIIDATGRIVMPGWCDSHTHLVYAGSREQEFTDKIKGLSYEEIAKRGGGILNSAKKLNEISEDELFIQAKKRVEAIIETGTTSVEIKSGYGLSFDGELKMLRVINRLKKEMPIQIKATFLGAHAIPQEYKNKKQEYIKMLTDKLLPKIAKEQLADFVDVFCEKGYFTAEDTEAILSEAVKYGLKPKVHVNQFNDIGGINIAIKYGALSVDHLEVMTKNNIAEMTGTSTMPVALPGCSFFLGIPYTPARTIIDTGLPLALATDFNPGSAPSGNMNFAVSTACIKMKMTPEEAINAGTINGAYAMGVENIAGSVTVGKRANLILTKEIESYMSIPYHFGMNLIDSVFVNV